MPTEDLTDEIVSNDPSGIFEEIRIVEDGITDDETWQGKRDTKPMR